MFTKTLETLKTYPTNLTYSQYDTIIRIIGDNRWQRHLKIPDGLFLYYLKIRCQWRMLPSDFPKWERVYYYFQKWSRDGTLEEIHEVLRNRLRHKRGKNVSPSVGVIDSQSVKTTKIGGQCRGVDGGKKIKGRKRHIVTDTQGLLLAVEVHAANEHDSKSGNRTIKLLKGRFERMTKIYDDGGYRGQLIGNVKNELGYDMEITLRTDKAPGFIPLPKRWVVERSFAWLEDFRRLSKDYEYKASTSETMIMMVFIMLMINKIN